MKGPDSSSLSAENAGKAEAVDAERRKESSSSLARYMAMAEESDAECGQDSNSSLASYRRSVESSDEESSGEDSGEDDYGGFTSLEDLKVLEAVTEKVLKKPMELYKRVEVAQSKADKEIEEASKPYMATHSRVTREMSKALKRVEAASTWAEEEKSKAGKFLEAAVSREQKKSHYGDDDPIVARYLARYEEADKRINRKMGVYLAEYEAEEERTNGELAELRARFDKVEKRTQREVDEVQAVYAKETKLAEKVLKKYRVLYKDDKVGAEREVEKYLLEDLPGDSKHNVGGGPTVERSEGTAEGTARYEGPSTGAVPARNKECAEEKHREKRTPKTDELNAAGQDKFPKASNFLAKHRADDAEKQGMETVKRTKGAVLKFAELCSSLGAASSMRRKLRQ